MKQRWLGTAVAGGLAFSGVTFGVVWLVGAIRGVMVAAMNATPPELALIGLVIGLYSVVLVFPLGLALGGWLTVGVVWGVGRLATLIGRCLRRPQDPAILRLPGVSRGRPASRKAA